VPLRYSQREEFSRLFVGRWSVKFSASTNVEKYFWHNPLLSSYMFAW